MQHTLSAPVHSELIVKKSRFIGCVQPVADRDGALAVVQSLRQAHPQATHVCWAMLAGTQAAAVDDGEPSGTAGRPMLEVLRHQQLHNVVATVVRYFGGVKLGAGGLVRAYTDAVAQALRDAPKVPIVAMQTLCLGLPYALEGLLRRCIDAEGAQLCSAHHGALVQLRVQLPLARVAAFKAQAEHLGQGQLQWLDDANNSVKCH
ncbi:IMPACT family protein [Comamonas faecalis]|uniref:IMPACT family protein n=1 Tax=Comamonas faecalis TaxID=1387849 RepID=A0ABP7S1Y8_9BURK